jgi:hypothetical protein
MPLLYSISRPLLASSDLTMHRNHPQETVISWQSSGVRNNRDHNQRPSKDSPGNIYSAHNTILSHQAASDRLHDPPHPDPTRSFTAPLNPRRRPLGRRSREQPSRSDIQPTNDQPPVPRSRHQKPLTIDHRQPTADCAPRDAPEPDSHFQRTNRHPRLARGQPHKRRNPITWNALPRHRTNRIRDIPRYLCCAVNVPNRHLADPGPIAE